MGNSAHALSTQKGDLIPQAETAGRIATTGGTTSTRTEINVSLTEKASGRI